MTEIKITSKIDLKTYFNISLLIYFRPRSFILMLIPFALIQYSLSIGNVFNWITEVIVIVVFVIVYGGIVPLRIYFSCKRNMRKLAYLREPIFYTLNADKIEYKGDTISAASNWQYVVKFIEREKYFLLMVSSRNFHFFPKEGFQSKEDIPGLKDLVREKGIKMTYH